MRGVLFASMAPSPLTVYAQVEGKKADLARDPAAFTAVAIESDDDDDAPQEKGFTKIQIADEDSSDEEVVEINQSGGFELPSPTEDEVLRKFETMDDDGNGTLSMAEIKQGFGALLRKHSVWLRSGKLDRARSRLYRGQNLQENMRWN